MTKEKQISVFCLVVDVIVILTITFVYYPQLLKKQGGSTRLNQVINKKQSKNGKN